METTIHRGKLRVWQEDKGFGFIQSEKGGEDIFLPLTALPKSSRRPQVGETILYSLRLEVDGKLSAHAASIEGLPANVEVATAAVRPSRMTLTVGITVVILLGVLIGSFFTGQDSDGDDSDAAAPTLIN